MKLSDSDIKKLIQYARYYFREFEARQRARHQGKMSFGSGMAYQAYTDSLAIDMQRVLVALCILHINKLMSLSDASEKQGIYSKIQKITNKYAKHSWNDRIYEFTSIEDLSKFYESEIEKTLSDSNKLNFDRPYYGHSVINKKLHNRLLDQKQKENIYIENKLSLDDISTIFLYLHFFKRVNQFYGIPKVKKKENICLDIIKALYVLTRRLFNKDYQHSFSTNDPQPRYIYGSRQFWNMAVFYRAYKYMEASLYSPASTDSAWQKLKFACKRYTINTYQSRWGFKLDKHVFIEFKEIKVNRIKELDVFKAILKEYNRPELNGGPLTDISFNILAHAMMDGKI